MFPKHMSFKSLLPLARESWRAGWPMALIMFFEFLMGLADVYVAGRLGKEMQAAYGLAFQLYFIFLIPAMALTTGAVSVVSQLFSADAAKKACEKRGSADAAYSSVCVVAAAAGIVGVCALVCSPVVIRFMAVPEVVKAAAIQLMRVYAAAIVCEYFVINSGALLRSCGKPKRPLVTMSIACVLNVFLNLTFVLYTPLKITGIAWATVISLCVACFLNFGPLIKIVGRAAVFSTTHVRRIVSVGWPAGLMQILWNTAAVVIFNILASLPRDGVAIVAAFTAATKIESAIFLPGFAFNLANAVVVGNFLGAGKQREAYRAGFVTAFLGTCLVTVLSIIVVCNARSILSVLSDDADVIRYGMQYVYISIFFEPLMSWGVILGGGLNGAGHTKDTMMIVSTSVWLVRLPLAYVLGRVTGFGAAGVWWAMNVSLIFQSFFMTVRYRRLMRPVKTA